MPLSNLVSSLEVMDKVMAAQRKDQSCGNVDHNLCYLNWLPQTPGFLKGLSRTCTLDGTHSTHLKIPSQRTVATGSENVHGEISKHLALGGKGLSFSQDVDSTVFFTNSSTCSARPPPFIFLVASIRPSVHGYSRDSRHINSGAFALFCFSFEKARL